MVIRYEGVKMKRKRVLPLTVSRADNVISVGQNYLCRFLALSIASNRMRAKFIPNPSTGIDDVSNGRGGGFVRKASARFSLGSSS